jgi:xanthine dehydrogenase YagR molybdenum-binding subunit
MALDKTYQQSTFASHFVEVAVDGYTGEQRIRRMLAVCDAGRILNPTAARSQVIRRHDHGRRRGAERGAGGGPAFRLFVNHDLAGYEVAVHADVPHQE